MIRNETARLLRRTAPALATLPLALALSGCGTLTGLNAENDFSCPMTPGGLLPFALRHLRGQRPRPHARQDRTRQGNRGRLEGPSRN